VLRERASATCRVLDVSRESRQNRCHEEANAVCLAWVSSHSNAAEFLLPRAVDIIPVVFQSLAAAQHEKAQKASLMC
jgi:hypothetical protein